MKALMAKAGENPNSLAATLKARTLQSQIQRFVDGTTKNPRWSTLEPVAKHYGLKVEAFLDDEAAEVVAIDRGLMPGQTANSLETGTASPPTPIRQGSRPIPIRDLVLQLGKALTLYDIPARKAVGSLLNDMANDPEDAARTADRIERLLGEPGNDLRPRSSSSNGG